MESIPKRLNKEPLFEAIWKIQFEPPDTQSIGEILPGVLYSALKSEHPELRLERLPIADIPLSLAQSELNLLLLPKYRMVDSEAHVIFQTRERIITVNSYKPYIGWEAFKKKIMTVIELVSQLGLISELLRNSLRYIDQLTTSVVPDLTPLRFSVTLGEKVIRRSPIEFNIELVDQDNFIDIVRIASPGMINMYGDYSRTYGTIVDHETFIDSPLNGWDVVKTQIKYLHDHLKKTFFQRLLTPEAIDSFQPEY
jgi:uncharacterized protein (TIGR04255 family)